MKLTLAEKIQLLRKRMGLNQGQLGARAFNLGQATGRTKIKNIELGKQTPTSDDLLQIAKVLNVPRSTFQREPAESGAPLNPTPQRIVVDPAVLNRFRKLKDYLDMLNRAVSIKDEQLIAHIAGKLSDIFTRSIHLNAINN